MWGAGPYAGLQDGDTIVVGDTVSAPIGLPCSDHDREWLNEPGGDWLSGTMRVTFVDRTWEELVLRICAEADARWPWWCTPAGWAFTAWVCWRVWRDR